MYNVHVKVVWLKIKIWHDAIYSTK